MKEKPGIVTAIAKHHMTEMARTIMIQGDIHSGRAIQDGSMNLLGCALPRYSSCVIGAGRCEHPNRNLMILGHGATRCHPYGIE